MAKLKANQFEYKPGLVITERPILFQTDMVQAILQGKKTQTRRNIKKIYSEICQKDDGRKWPWWSGEYEEDIWMDCPYGKPGDLLWVRESFLKLDRDHVINSEYAYKANGNANTEDLRKDYVKSGRKYHWKPSIHMPKDACRIWLMVEEVRVERLQDISEEDAIDEGLKKGKSIVTHIYRFLDYQCGKYTFNWPSSSFQSLWKFINGEESWDSNPWVWVIKFRVLSKTGRPSREEILSAYYDVTSECNANEETASPASGGSRSDGKEVSNG